MSEDDLTTVPGVGSARANALESANYCRPVEIADASISELATVDGLDTETAKCIRQGAKERRGDNDSIINQLASEVDESRQTVMSDYESIVAHRGSIEQKTAALRDRYTDDTSIMTVADHSPFHLYSLYIAGFDDIEAVSEAAIDELTDAPFITYQAEEIRESARRAVGIEPQENAEESPSDEKDSYVCEECGSEFSFESVLRKHSYSCHGSSDTTSVEHTQSSDTPATGGERNECFQQGTEGINPSFLSEYYEGLRALRTGIETVYDEVGTYDLSEPIAQYYQVIAELLGREVDSDAGVNGYGPQQNKRVAHGMSEYRQAYGNGDWITDYQCLSVDTPERAVQPLIDDETGKKTTVIRPVAPYSSAPLPIVVESRRDLKGALKLLAELPAEPSVTDKSDPFQDRFPVQAMYADIVDGASIETISITPPESPSEQPASEQTDDDVPLKEVPGIGDKRAEALRDAGYDSVSAVAEASLSELYEIPEISKTAARCVHPLAKEKCSQESVLSEIVDEVEASREEVVSAYGQLAPAFVTPDEAEETLRQTFDPDAGWSVCNLEESALRHRHYIRVSGYETIDSVTEASIEELTDASYIGPTVARNLKTEAEELVAQHS